MENFINMFNIYGLVTAVILFVPEIIYAKQFKPDRSIFANRAMLYIERMGKYGSLFLMGINTGVLESGFTSELMRRFWFVSVAVMTVICVVLWILCFRKTSKALAYILTVVTALIFMLSGLLQVKTLLLTAGVVYLAGQLYVTKIYTDTI